MTTTKTFIEKDFVSELFWAQIMGEPTEGLSSRWAKTNITALEAEKFCQKRTDLEIKEIERRYTVSVLGEETVYEPKAMQEAIAEVQANPWRLPTDQEWEEDFKANPFQHCLYGWTSSEENGDRITRGGGWLNARAESFRAFFRYGNAPADRSLNLGFRCARKGPWQL